tara:strand:+ start:397 stop:852 length:456 start_codon:yes stop_codon:yes gene_type:complete
MTVLEANIKLFCWFQEKHCFEPDKDTLDLLVVTDYPDEDKAAILCALKELEQMGCIASQKVDDKTYYILKKDFSSAAEQKVEISGYTADMLAGCLNHFCDKIGDQKDQCDPTSIKEKDIRNAVLIMQHYYKIEQSMSDDLSDTLDMPPSEQ